MCFSTQNRKKLPVFNLSHLFPLESRNPQFKSSYESKALSSSLISFLLQLHISAVILSNWIAAQTSDRVLQSEAPLIMDIKCMRMRTIQNAERNKREKEEYATKTPETHTVEGWNDFELMKHTIPLV